MLCYEINVSYILISQVVVLVDSHDTFSEFVPWCMEKYYADATNRTFLEYHSEAEELWPEAANLTDMLKSVGYD